MLNLAKQFWRENMSQGFIMFVVSVFIMFRWDFAIFIIPMIIIHEYGHVFAMRQCGYTKIKIIYLPFVGAGTHMQKDPVSYEHIIRISAMGPLAGILFGIIVGLLYLITGQPFFGAVMYVILAFHLINLLPLTILDGGRIFTVITYSIHPKFGKTVALIMPVLIFVLTYIYLGKYPMIPIIIGIIGLIGIWNIADISNEYKRFVPLSWTNISLVLLLYIEIFVITFLTLNGLVQNPGVKDVLIKMSALGN